MIDRRLLSHSIFILSSLCVLTSAAFATGDSPVPGAYVDPLASPPAWDAESSVSYAPGRLVIQLAPEAARGARTLRLTAGRLDAAPGALGVASVDRLAARLGGARFEPEFPGATPPAPGSRAPDLTRFWLAELDPGADLAHAASAFGALAEVTTAERSAIVPVAAIANDSLWSKAYYFYQPSRRDLHMPEAWDLTVSDTASVIAILDTGCLLDHPDLGGRIAGEHGQYWENRAERDGVAGVDDDLNGYTDDVIGWDFVALQNNTGVVAGEDWKDQDNDPNDFAFHGTAVAGVAAAITFNGAGVAGTAPGARLMALRVGWATTVSPTGQVDLSRAAQAVSYATLEGATVLNLSFAATNQTDLVAAIANAVANGVVAVAAAGNNGTPHVLADLPSVIAVAATDNLDKLQAFSNRGAYVDLCAPGYALSTTSLLIPRPVGDSLAMRQPSYTAGATGTSFSAPLACGAVALLQSWRRARGLPPMEPRFVELRLKETCDDISSQNASFPGLFGAGRLNVYRALSDPPTSYGIRFGGRTVGAPLVLRTLDGGVRLVSVTDDAQFVVLEAASGDTLARMPLPAAPAGGLAMADLGGGLGTGLFVALADGRIAGLDPLGEPLAGWPVYATRVSGIAERTPSLGDVDGDGVLDVIWGGDDGQIHAWSARGERLAGFPRVVGAPGRNVLIAISDLDGAPGAEIAGTTEDGSLHVIRGNGFELAGFPVSTPLAPTGPIIVSARADSVAPIVVVAGKISMRAWDGTGRQVFGRTQGGDAFGEMAAGDLDGDGLDEIISPNINAGNEQLGLMRANGVLVLNRRIGDLDGPPVIGALRPQGGAGVGIITRAGDERTLHALDAQLNEVRTFIAKIGLSGASPTLADLDGDTATEIAAGAGGDGSFYVYDAGVGTRGATRAPWAMPGGNPARTSSRLYAPGEIALDNAPPAPVLDLAVQSASFFTAVLQWTSPTDLGPSGRAQRYDLRLAPFPLGEASFASGISVPVGPPASAGAVEHALIAPLEEDRAYWFALRSRDAAGNWSAVSNVLAMSTGHAFPAAVTDLAVVAGGDSSLTLRWTATGDDARAGRPTRYRIRVSPAPIRNSDFDALTQGMDVAATADAGGTESAVMRGLDPARRWWIALRAEDEDGHPSLLSNVVASLVGRFAGRSGAVLAPRRQPTAAPVELLWQGDAAPGAASALRVFDLTGRQVAAVALSGAGGTAVWDGRINGGARAPSGIYFAELSSGVLRARTRIALVR